MYSPTFPSDVKPISLELDHFEHLCDQVHVISIRFPTRKVPIANRSRTSHSMLHDLVKAYSEDEGWKGRDCGVDKGIFQVAMGWSKPSLDRGELL